MTYRLGSGVKVDCSDRSEHMLVKGSRMLEETFTHPNLRALFARYMIYMAFNDCPKFLLKAYYIPNTPEPNPTH